MEEVLLKLRPVEEEYLLLRRGAHLPQGQRHVFVREVLPDSVHRPGPRRRRVEGATGGGVERRSAALRGGDRVAGVAWVPRPSGGLCLLFDCLGVHFLFIAGTRIRRWVSSVILERPEPHLRVQKVAPHVSVSPGRHARGVVQVDDARLSSTCRRLVLGLCAPRKFVRADHSRPLSSCVCVCVCVYTTLG